MLVIGVLIFSYGLASFNVGNTLSYLILRKKKDDENLIERKDPEEEDFEEDLSVENLAGDLFTGGLYTDALEKDTFDVTTLLSLPENLRKAGLAVLKLKEGSVDEVAAETGSTGREAKNYLDRLALMNILGKKREGDQMIYYGR